MNVGSGENRRYANEFWVERGRDGAPERADVVVRGVGRRRQSARLIRSRTGIRRRRRDDERHVDERHVDERVDGEAQTDAGRRATAALPARGPGTARRCRGGATRGDGPGTRRRREVDFRLEDAEALAKSGRFDALVGNTCATRRTDGYSVRERRTRRRGRVTRQRATPSKEKRAFRRHRLP